MAPALLISIGTLFVVGIVYFFYITEAHEAKPWVDRRESLMRVAEDFGLQADEDGRTARGEFAGIPFSVGLKSVRHGKGKTMSLWTRLEMPGSPPDLRLKQEGVFSGIGKFFGSKEISIGDPEFDAAFLISGNSADDIKAYLTPELKKILLFSMSSFKGAVFRNQAITTVKNFQTPFFLEKHFAQLLEGSKSMAMAINGSSEAIAELSKGGVSLAAEKLRKFAFKGLFLWCPLLILSLVDGDPTLRPYQFVFGLGLTLSSLCLSGKDIFRVLLQGYYAFLAAVTFFVLLLGSLEFAEILSGPYFRLGEENFGPFLFFGVIALLLLIGFRNYLKTLDRVRVVISE